jgi:hypothetical protein
MPKVQYSYDTALASCKETVGAQIYKELERHLAGANVKWVGEQKPDNMHNLMLLATCLHDLHAVSYGVITKLLHTKFRCSDKTVQKNIKRARHALANWGRAYIIWPTRTQLDQAVSQHKFPLWMNKVRWWMDSTDVPIARLEGVRSPKGEWWSAKLGGPGRRYMALVDGDRLIRRLWGGYSPKFYDGQFMRLEKRWFEEKCAGTAILADTHFFAARELINDPEIIAPPPENATEDLLFRRNFASDTAEAARKRNDITERRGVVEQTFASIKALSAFLAGGPGDKWQDDPDELDSVVEWVVGVHNKRIINERRLA